MVVKTLNAWYPPLDAQGKPVDVSKLDIAGAAGAPSTTPPAPTPGAPPTPGVPTGGGVRPPG